MKMVKKKISNSGARAMSASLLRQKCEFNGDASERWSTCCYSRQSGVRREGELSGRCCLVKQSGIHIANLARRPNALKPLRNGGSKRVFAHGNRRVQTVYRMTPQCIRAPHAADPDGVPSASRDLALRRALHSSSLRSCCNAEACVHSSLVTVDSLVISFRGVERTK